MAAGVEQTNAPPWLAEPKKRAAFRAALGAWFARHGRDLPWRHTRDPYAILVSELMLQQTQVVTVLPYFARWLRQFPDARALAAASEAEVLRAWEGLGYYARARNLHRAAKAIVEEHGGEFPRALAGIAALPGVGRYTAGAVATFAFDAATPIVDANIARVLARLLDLATPIDTAAGQRALWFTAETLLPAEEGDDGASPRLYNSALMELGALICRARAPQCLLCPVRDFCAAFAASTQEQRPVKKGRRATVELREDCAWILQDGRVLLQQQNEGARWRGLWKLPPAPQAAARPRTDAPLFQTIYPFTHHRVTLRVFAAPAPSAATADQAWHAVTALGSVAVAAPHRRALQHLLERRGGSL